MELSDKGFLSLLVVSLVLNFWPNAASAQKPQRNAAPPSSVNNSATKPKKSYEIKLKILDAAAREKLLNTRINSSLGQTFGAFSNMFFVRSKLDTDTCVGLSSDVEGISERELMPAFPHSYKCTLRELLDVVAMQTNTKWAYREESQVMGADSPDKKTADGIAIFSFVAADVKPKFEMTAAKGWKKIEHSSWTMFVPPTAPMGMDFHVGGKLSADTPEKLKELLKTAPRDAALDEYKRVKPDATANDLKPAKIGPYDAYLFEAALPPNGEEKVRWRQWHFVVDNQLVFVISTLFKDKEASLYPDVEQMIKTFRVREPKESQTM